jgi:hypothetical protein
MKKLIVVIGVLALTAWGFKKLVDFVLEDY